jgi:DNA mismatch repair ATPase MutS
MLFATHYAALTAEVAGNPRVALGYMAALVGDPDGDEARSITFLYQKRSGVCPSR